MSDIKILYIELLQFIFAFILKLVLFFDKIFCFFQFLKNFKKSLIPYTVSSFIVNKI